MILKFSAAAQGKASWFLIAMIISVCLFSSSISAVPYFKDLPIVTLQYFVYIISLVYIILLFYYRRVSINFNQISNFNIIFLLITGLCLLIFLLLSKNPIYGSYKIYIFFIRTVTPSVLLYLLLNQANYTKTVSLVYFWASFTAILIPLFYGYTDLYISGLDTISLSRILGLSLLMSMYFLFESNTKILFNLFNILIFCLSFLSMVIIGQRGPILSVFLVIILSQIFISLKNIKILFKSAILVTIIFSSVFYFVTNNLEELSPHLAARLNSTGQNASDDGRIERIDAAFMQLENSSFVGVGTGGFNFTYLFDEDLEVGNYPHNMIVEFLVELGFIGMLIVFFYATLIYRIARYSIFSKRNLLFLLWLYALFNAMVSADIARNYQVWLFGTLTASLLIVSKKGATTNEDLDNKSLLFSNK